MYKYFAIYIWQPVYYAVCNACSLQPKYIAALEIDCAVSR